MPKPKKRSRKLDFKRVCRVCLTERGHLRDIFSTKLPKMMEMCASVQVDECDKLPPFVCVSCFHLIAKFYTFKKQMERNDRFLRSCLKQMKRKQSDILNIAISQAEIDGNGETNEEDDIPLSKLKMERNIEDCKQDIMEIQPVKIFPDEPPPLVLLQDKTSKSPKNEEQVLKCLPELPEDPPPLIPITSLVKVEQLITNVLLDPLKIDFRCHSCNEHFVTIRELKEHKLNSTNCNNNNLRCTVCCKEFNDRKRLIGHLKGHMIAKNYICKICGKSYPNPSTLTVHIRTHTGERPFKCQICNKGFMRWSGVVAHMRTHESHKPFKCELCERSFKISSNLQRHKILHQEKFPYCCNYCGKTFSQADNLQLHIRSYHTNERPYLCNICGKCFVSAQRLKRHMWVHTGYKPYSCSFCPKSYSNSNDLKIHERGHLGGEITEKDKPFVCKICKMRFYHACRLNKHMKIHDKPLFTCSFCGKHFTTSNLLDSHLNSKHNTQNVDNVVASDSGDVQVFVKYQ